MVAVVIVLFIISPYSSLGELPCILFNIPDGKQAVLPSEPKSPQKVPRVQKTSQVAGIVHIILYISHLH